MFSIFLACSPQDSDALIAELWEAGTAGIVEEPGGLRAFFEDGVDAVRLGGEIRREDTTDWVQATRDAWPPVLVGSRFFLVPPWCEEPTPKGRIRLEINPGMACGTGRHPCTRLCLEALEACVRPGDVVLDVGTGSGILCSAAMLLGARVAIGCDIDAESIEVARERVDAAFFVGSADAVRSASADMIVANISAAAAEDLAAEFARVRKTESTLIVSGFPESDLPYGYESGTKRSRDGWACVLFRS